MAKPRANLRLFVAVYPPPELAALMIAALNGLELPPHRVTPPEQIHLTLQFIGDTPAKEIDRTIESVERSASGLEASSLQVERMIALPERGRARLIAIETNAPSTLLELQRRLATRLASNVRRKPGDRFLPHFTVCRFRPPERLPWKTIDLTLPPIPLREILLMRSTLAPAGAQHHELARFPLIDQQ